MIGNSFIQSAQGLLWCKHALLCSAHKVFGRMPIRSTGNKAAGVSLGVSGARNKAVTYKDALDRFGYAGVLNACATNEDLTIGRTVHGLVIVSGLARRSFLTNSLIDMYSRCGMINKARFVFDHAEELDDGSWNSLLSAYVRAGWPEVAADVLVWMHRNGMALSSIALANVARAVNSGSDDAKLAQRLLRGCVIKVGLDMGFFVGGAMHYIFADDGGLDEVVEIFDYVSNPSLVVCNAMIRGFSRLQTETSKEVSLVPLRLCVEMINRRMRPSNLTLKYLLEACISNKELDFAKQVHAYIVKNKQEEDESVAAALIAVYADLGSAEGSLKCFNDTPKLNIITWDSMIEGYIQNGELESAMNFFQEFLRLGRKPGENMTSCLLVGAGDFGAARSGQQLHSCAVKDALEQVTDFENSLIYFYSNIGDVDSSIKKFMDISTTDVNSWSLIILSHALHGLATDALLLFDKVHEFKLSPSSSSFLAALVACSRRGLIDKAFRYLDIMVNEYGLLPNVKHYACVVDLLGRSKRYAEAEDFILNLDCGEDPIMWHALLSSCQFHGDTEWSIRVAEKLMEVDPLAPTSYTVLHGIYSGMKKVSLAMRIRGRMRERGLTKETDVSWIEIGMVVHSFMAGDCSHPQSRLILAKLEEMLFKLDDDEIHENWKESLVKCHGEIFAVALGMICLPDSVSVRVMRSQNTCRDSHKLLRLLSESERREIVVRDRTQFHHFAGGSCSCEEIQ